MGHLRNVLCASVLVLLVGAGCGPVVYTATDIATRFLSVPATVAPPDTLRNVHLHERDDGRLAFQSDQSFGELRMHWSSGYRADRGVDILEAGNFSTFATLWSRELRLASMNSRTSIGAYEPGEAKEAIAREVDAPHNETVQIDVHVYIDRGVRSSYGATNLRSARWEIFLLTSDGTRHPPENVEAGIARRLSWSDDTRAHYRPNILTFERRPDDETDLLAEPDSLELHIRDSVQSLDVMFGWRFE